MSSIPGLVRSPFHPFLRAEAVHLQQVWSRQANLKTPTCTRTTGVVDASARVDWSVIDDDATQNQFLNVTDGRMWNLADRGFDIPRRNRAAEKCRRAAFLEDEVWEAVHDKVESVVEGLQAVGNRQDRSGRLLVVDVDEMEDEGDQLRRADEKDVNRNDADESECQSVLHRASGRSIVPVQLGHVSGAPQSNYEMVVAEDEDAHRAKETENEPCDDGAGFKETIGQERSRKKEIE